jgi:ABC-type uncharacterized transport system involved in gliding motility auxiliary subunit/ABC-type transport system involved in multi-copper enzyme maturation permease subunit
VTPPYGEHGPFLKKTGELEMSVRNIKTILKSEIAGYFVSPATYVFVIIFLVLSGFFTFMVGDFFQADDASLRGFFTWHPWLYLILVPAVGMHLWSDERRLGTDELLFTMPVTVAECVVGKFLAAWLFVGLALALTFPMVITVCYLGDPDWGQMICGYAGSFLMAGAYLAVASFTSSITKSQVVSFILSVVVCFFLIMSGWPSVTDMLVNWASPKLIDTVAAFSVMPRFENMLRGVVALGDVLYFVSVAGFALFLTALSLKRHSKTSFSTVAGALVVGLALVFANAIFSELIGGRFDFTENSVYTLSNASKRILGKIDRPVTIKFYCSRSNTRMPVVLKNFADRVEDLLEEYKRAGNGRVFVEKYDPKPLSDAEDSAIMDGMAGQLFDSFGEKVYLGLAISCGKKHVAIPFLSPAQENLLEYDVTGAITEVFRTKKTVLGVMSPFPVLGGPPTQAMMQRGIYRMQQPWIFVKQLKKLYNVRKVRLDVRKIDEDIDVLLLIDPGGITDDTQYAIDQFILRGGKVAAFLDPKSFVAETMSHSDHSLFPATTSSLPLLLRAWGVNYVSNYVAADAVFAHKPPRNTGRGAVNFVAVLDLTKQAFNKNDVTTTKLDSVNLIFSGVFPGTPPQGLEKDILIHTTKDAGVIPAPIANDPRESFKSFVSGGKELALAVRLRGHFKTAFPDGPPWEQRAKKAAEREKNKKNKDAATKDAGKKNGADGNAETANSLGNEKSKPKDENAPLRESRENGVVVLIGDSDMLYDEFCVQVQTVRGQRYLQPVNDNLGFALNTIDYLGGDSDLIGIRCRPAIKRPFEEIKRREAIAEKKFKSKILELEKQLRATQNRLNALQRKKTSDAQKMILSQAQQEELGKFRKDQVRIRKDLKQVQKEFKKEIDSLKNLLKWINIALMPLMVALFGILVAIVRGKRGRAQ